MPSIHFFYEDIQFKVFNPKIAKAWIKQTILLEKRILGNLNYIFCSDLFLHQINLQYLNHDTYTDIITFDNSETKKSIVGDIYISVDRVRANALTFKTDFDRELDRVMVHGVLHLLGYSDKKKQERVIMRKKEDTYLSLKPIGTK